MPISLIDLFAGPGGLNEGFSHIRDPRGGRAFKTALSVECERTAHRTLELRAFYRELEDTGETGNYYRYLRGEIDRRKLFRLHPAAARAAKEETLRATLGRSERNNLRIEARIAAALEKTAATNCVLIGGPPCQAYSLVGRARRKHDRKFKNDKKHFLYLEYLRIVKRFKPAVFLMENVPGLLSAKNKGMKMFELICADLREAGYTLHPISPPEGDGVPVDEPKRYVVHAEDFGVPQSRSRVFILGLRGDLSLAPGSLVRAEADPVTVADVLKDLPRIRSKLSRQKDTVDDWRKAIQGLSCHHFSHLEKRFRDELMRRLAIIPWGYRLGERAMKRPNGGPRKLADWFIHPECNLILNHNSRAHMAADLMRYFFWAQYAEYYEKSPSLQEVPHFLRPDHKNVSGDLAEMPFSDRFRVQIENRPSTTIVSHIAKDGHYYIHYEPKQCRSLSVREAARLQTFPDNYFFEGAATDQYRQVGNAVPPFLARQIAAVVHAILTGATKKPERVSTATAAGG